MITIPVEDCSRQGKPGKRWGEGGKCYHGKGAEEKAKAQGRAVEASKHAAKANEQLKTDVTLQENAASEHSQCMKEKIKKLMNEGKEQDQAVAIAYKYCGDDTKGNAAKPDIKSLIAEEKDGAKQYQAYAEDDPKNKKIWEEMAADEAKHAGLLAELKTNGATLHTNDVKVTGKPIYKDNQVTVVPVLLTEEGVHNNGLKDWDTLYDPNGLEGFLWFEHRPIVDGHPGYAVNHLVPKYGYIQNVEPDPATRTVPAEAVLFNKMFTNAEMAEIDSGHWRGVSIGYYCGEIKQNGTFNGIHYDHLEVGPIYGDHVALVNRPACKRCGLNTNAECTNCGKCSTGNNDMTKEGEPAKTGAEGALTATNQAEPLKENDDVLVLKAKGNKAIQKIEQKIKANSMPEGMAERAEAILKIPDDFAKQRAALDFVLDIALAEEDEGDEGMETNSVKVDADADKEGKCPKMKKEAEPPEKEPPTKKNEDSVMKELEPLVKSVDALTTLVQNQAKEIADLKGDSEKLKKNEELRNNALKADEEKKLSDQIKKNFDKAYQMDWDTKHWPAIKSNALGVTGFLADKENLKHWDPKGDEAVEIEPVGLNFAGIQENMTTRAGLKMLSVEELGKKQYPGVYKPKEAGKA